ncbi:hypothetical protein HANVADRAFT_53058 [Hanseniaspora valbyensis NRRL Y-1626]|uniref:Uncharacterized protein n=1 Tax=Hanseniaspora valbyensis NRRL Y-1626 TaxID=766949 RepID=A0A1B7TD05_9ASCO|nr:hypothetical protein HANVADRAFT_53058 [Hanseniaspora valbyensis NRRL Y-1626]
MVQLSLVSNLQQVYSNREELEKELDSTAQEIREKISQLQAINKDNIKQKASLENYKNQLEKQISEVSNEK